MATEPLTFYPAYTFSASPTYFAWVKLTAHDIHRSLRSRLGFSVSTTNSKSELLFVLNHPIQFVQVVGVIVAYEDYYEKFWSFTVDDGSGEVVECVCWKPDKSVKDAQDHEAEVKPKIDVERQKRDEIIQSLDIGSVVQVKGTISTFRDVRQIQIERITVVPTTNAEMKLVAARTKFLEEVLMKAWVISPNRQRRLLKDTQGEVKRESERLVRMKARAKKTEERERKHADRIARDYKAEEKVRRTAAEEARQAGIDLQERRLSNVPSDDFADLTY